MTTSTVEHHAVTSREQWLTARKELLAEEKALTRAKDALSAKRRELPWVKVEKAYRFDTPDGEKTLAELFDGRSQLIVKHFMFGPEWTDGCVGCSFEVDHIGGALVHLEHHDVSYVAVARAPLAKIEKFKKRMGWNFRWVSSYGSDFNFDYQVSFTPEQIAGGKVTYNYTTTDYRSDEASGHSIFYKDERGDIYHTYSSYGRGTEDLVSTYVCLDLTPKGRNENGPGRNLTDWVRHHDRYEADGFVDRTGRFVSIDAAKSDTCCHSTEQV